MKKMIINADDLGLSVAVSRGIEQAHLGGAVTSASLLANFPAFAEGIRVARENPALGIGVHLNLIRGAPVAAPDKVAPLLTADRQKFRGGFWRIGYAAWQTDFIAAAEIEYRAQIEKVLAAGIAPDHLDFEKHHGVWAPLYRLGGRLAAEYHLGLRAYNEPLSLVRRRLPGAGLRAGIRAAGLRAIYAVSAINLPRLKCPDYFFGQTQIGKIDGALLAALVAHCPAGVSELMCHPGLRDETEEAALAPLVGTSWITACRDRELAALGAENWRQRALDAGVELTTYAGAMSARVDQLT